LLTVVLDFGEEKINIPLDAVKVLTMERNPWLLVLK
jgi:hypothetical protein